MQLCLPDERCLLRFTGQLSKASIQLTINALDCCMQVSEVPATLRLSCMMYVCKLRVQRAAFAFHDPVYMFSLCSPMPPAAPRSNLIYI